MKIKYILVGSLAFLQLFAKAQSPRDSLNRRLSKTEIELVYDQYLQNGENSAITGGIGTEKLTIFGPALNIKTTFGENSIAFNFGSDIISSASTDNIDYVVSSASSIDLRNHAEVTYSHNFGKKNLVLRGGFGFSMESDYLSFSQSAGISKTYPDRMRTLSADVRIYSDDLRWGRLNEDYHRPVTLVYPSELRFRDWYDTYKRHSYNLQLGVTQTLNKRTSIGVFPDFTLQQGLLSTPFHRVYFNTDSLAVEQLPEKRIKASLAIKLNRFVGGNVILKNTLNTYVDNFAIAGIALENETAFKLRSYLTLMPAARIYYQKGSKYFAAYKMHSTTEEFYTCDYDLSTFTSFKIGVGLKYNPQKYISKRVIFNGVTVRYSYYYRSNKLSSHIISLAIQTTGNRR